VHLWDLEQLQQAEAVPLLHRAAVRYLGATAGAFRDGAMNERFDMGGEDDDEMEHIQQLAYAAEGKVMCAKCWDPARPGRKTCEAHKRYRITVVQHAVRRGA
jgi:hypothetical protein